MSQQSTQRIFEKIVAREIKKSLDDMIEENAETEKDKKPVHSEA